MQYAEDPIHVLRERIIRPHLYLRDMIVIYPFSSTISPDRQVTGRKVHTGVVVVPPPPPKNVQKGLLSFHGSP